MILAVDTHYLLRDISAFLSDKGGFKPRCHAPCLPWISGDLGSKLREKTPVSMITKEPKDVRSGYKLLIPSVKIIRRLWSPLQAKDCAAYEARFGQHRTPGNILTATFLPKTIGAMVSQPELFGFKKHDFRLCNYHLPVW